MSFELGKTYIVDVTEKGIVPLMEFDRNRWFDKDHDDLDLLTDEEKIVIVNNALGRIREEIEQIEINGYVRDVECFTAGINTALNVINKYRNEMDEE